MFGIHQLGGFGRLGPVRPQAGAICHEDWEMSLSRYS